MSAPDYNKCRVAAGLIDFAIDCEYESMTEHPSTTTQLEAELLMKRFENSNSTYSKNALTPPLSAEKTLLFYILLEK